MTLEEIHSWIEAINEEKKNQYLDKMREYQMLLSISIAPHTKNGAKKLSDSIQKAIKKINVKKITDEKMIAHNREVIKKWLEKKNKKI